MADVKICDRCGKRLTEDCSIFNVKPSHYTLNVTLFRKKAYSYMPEAVKTQHDLCIECTTKLAEWMESGETEESK